MIKTKITQEKEIRTYPCLMESDYSVSLILSETKGIILHTKSKYCLRQWWKA